MPAAPNGLHSFWLATSAAGSHALPILSPSALSGTAMKSPLAGVIMRHCQSSVIAEAQTPVRSIGACARGAGGGVYGGGVCGACAPSRPVSPASPEAAMRPATTLARMPAAAEYQKEQRQGCSAGRTQPDPPAARPGGEIRPPPPPT